MNQYDLKINVGHRDLHFMVQQLYVISWGLFDVLTSSLQIMGQYDWTFDDGYWQPVVNSGIAIDNRYSLAVI